MKIKWLILFTLSISFSFTMSSCGKEAVNNEIDNSGQSIGGKGDTPTGDWVELCEDREADVISTGKTRFLSDALRWPVADVEGVTATEDSDDRGQEYAEYFVITKVPNKAGDDYSETSVILGHPSTRLDVELNDDQKFFLEDEVDASIGKCVFTSWHQDVPGPLPCEKEGGCPKVLGNNIDSRLFRMTSGLNSNAAAADLVRESIRKVESEFYQKGDEMKDDDFLHRDFMRGCAIAKDLYQTHWRSSDSQICSTSMRLVECGCSVGGDESIDLEVALIPSIEEQQAKGGIFYRGFPLGSWEATDTLPSGCEYVEIGKEFDGKASQTIVTCDLSAADLLKRPEDPKELCRQKYGEDIILYLPIPKDALQCDPPKEGRYSEHCSEMPWVVSATKDVGK